MEPIRLRPARHALPGNLPEGERVLWQGAPEWRSLARNALHLRGLAIYLVAIIAAVGVSGALEGEAAGRIGFEVLRAACAASVPLLLGVAYAWAVARGAYYTITTHRVILKMGVAFSITLNLPFAQIESAGLLMRRDGSGDIALRFVEGTRGLGWFILWPHARGWRLARGEPMLRALPDAERAAQILSRALAASADMAIPVSEPTDLVDNDTRDLGANQTAAVA